MYITLIKVNLMATFLRSPTLLQFSSLQIILASFAYDASLIWNNLLEEICPANSLPSFKVKVLPLWKSKSTLIFHSSPALYAVLIPTMSLVCEYETMFFGVICLSVCLLIEIKHYKSVGLELEPSLSNYQVSHKNSNMFRISANVDLYNSITLDMSGGFLLMIVLHLWPVLLLVVNLITVTHFEEHGLPGAC